MKTAGLFSVSAGFLFLAGSAAFAAPVEYVKICDAFGTGFFYIPGTDVCLKVGGYVRADVEHEFSSGVFGFTGEIHPEIDVQKETPYGTLRGFLSFNFDLNAAFGGATTDPEFTWERDEAFLEFGPALGGWTASTFDYAEPYTYLDTYQSAITTLQFRYTFLAGGYTIAVAVEDPHDRDLGTDFPALALAMSPTALWGFTGSAAVADTPYGLGVAAQVGFEAPVLVNASVRGVLAFAHNAQSYVGLDGSAPGFAWSASVSGKFALGIGLNLVGQLSYADGPATDGELQVVGGVHFAPTEMLEFGAELFHRRSIGASTSNGFFMRAQFNF
jgi:hypothetical protein